MTTTSSSTSASADGSRAIAHAYDTRIASQLIELEQGRKVCVLTAWENTGPQRSRRRFLTGRIRADERRLAGIYSRQRVQAAAKGAA